MRTLFELTYLNFTAPGNDREAYDNLISMLKTTLENIEKQPEAAFSDSIMSTFYKNDPRVRRVTYADLAEADYDLARQIAAQRFASPSDFNFYFVGNFNTDSLRTYCEQYIASIPAGKAEKKRDPKLELAKPGRDNKFIREMETPKGNIVQVYHGENPYSDKEAEVVNALGEILSQRLLKTVREEHSFAYSCGASASSDYRFKEEYTLQIYCPVKPAKADSATALIRQTIEEIAANGVTEEELGKVKEFELKEYADNQKKNNYWIELMQSRVNWGRDRRTGREDAIRSVTSADVQAFCRDILLKKGTRLSVTMLPASFEETE